MFNPYFPSYQQFETFPHILLTNSELEWDSANATIDRNIPNGVKACVAEMSRECSKGGPTDFFHKSDLILGSVIDSLVAYRAMEWLVLSVNMKEAAPSRIGNGKAKEKMVHKKWTLNKMVTN